MGWADLWRDILLYDVLRDEPTLRAMPVPEPLDLVSCDNGRGAQLDCPIPFRGIAFIKGAGDNPNGDGCLKLVHMEANATVVPGNEYDDETGSPNFQVHDWTILTYTNTAMTTSWKDWKRDSRVQASDITIDAQIKSELLQSGLLGSAPGEALHNLLVSHPALDISAAPEAAHQGVVYMMARKKYKQPKAWVLALDTKNKTLLGAAEFGTERQPWAPVMYCPSAIAKYMDPEMDTSRQVLNLLMRRWIHY
ncbi:unnamed protein product [Urochloa humidicola]